MVSLLTVENARLRRGCADHHLTAICAVDGSSERGEKDASKITTYPPGAVRFDCELRAVQVSCGFHHSGKLEPRFIILKSAV